MEANAKKMLYSVKEAAEYLPISESKIYADICEGKIPSIKFGRRVFVPSYYIEGIMKQCISA